MITPEIKVLPDPSAVAEEAARRVVAIAHESIERQDSFSIVLSGGSTPKALYEKLASEPFRSQMDWAKAKVFFGDERCVPPDDADSNYRMARLALLSEVPIPGDNIYRIRGEIDPQQAAIEYGQMLKEQFGDGGADLVLLGMGDDGHTASLFPNTEALKETKHRCVANYVEKMKAWRVTMTAPFINRSQHVMVLVCGANKASRVEEVLEGPSEPERLPIQRIAPPSGSMTWLLDAAAAGMQA
jgi:6-phosphogluconolactonase